MRSNFRGRCCGVVPLGPREVVLRAAEIDHRLLQDADELGFSVRAHSLTELKSSAAAGPLEH
jgi:hypothetical protein